MKLRQETYTQLIKDLQDLNQEIRVRLSSMPLSMGQEMQKLGVWLEEVKSLEQNLKNASSLITHHLELLEKEYLKQLNEDTLKD